MHIISTRLFVYLIYANDNKNSLSNVNKRYSYFGCNIYFVNHSVYLIVPKRPK